MNSMKGKRILITGPTSGVGEEIALQLAPLGRGAPSSAVAM